MSHISWWHLWVFIIKCIRWWETQVHRGCCIPPLHPATTLRLLFHWFCMSVSVQKTWQQSETAEKLKQEKHKMGGLTWHRAPLWQFNRKAFFFFFCWMEPLLSYTASVFICPFVNVRDKAEMPGLCVFLAVSWSCGRTKGDIYINTVPMSVAHVTWQRGASCRRDLMCHIMDLMWF